jgi:hypothetical protein
MNATSFVCTTNCCVAPLDMRLNRSRARTGQPPACVSWCAITGNTSQSQAWVRKARARRAQAVSADSLADRELTVSLSGLEATDGSEGLTNAHKGGSFASLLRTHQRAYEKN